MRCDSKWRRRISRVLLIGNRLSGNMLSFAFRKTSAEDYQRRPANPWPPTPLRSMWAPITLLVGSRSIPCGHGLRHVGTDYGQSDFPAHITTVSLPTSERFRCPHPLESPAHIDRNPQIGTQLRTFLGSGRVLDRSIYRIAFSSDASFYRPVPHAIVQPATLEEIGALF